MKPRYRVKAICVFVGATPDETAAAASSFPVLAVVANNSVSAMEPAAMLSAGTTAGLCLADPTVPADVISVSAPNIAETAAAVRVQARQITVAADIPDMPAFLLRDANNIPGYARA